MQLAEVGSLAFSQFVLIALAAKMEARQRKIAKLRKIADSEKRERKKNANLFSQYLSISNC